MNRILLTLIVTCSLYSAQCYSQDSKSIAKEKGTAAVKLADEKKYDEAIAVLREAHQLDPEAMEYMYEIGYCHYAKKDYKQAVKYFNEILHHKNTSDRVYQMLGNVYDDMGDTLNALKTYKDGVAKFPTSGGLYTELGTYH